MPRVSRASFNGKLPGPSAIAATNPKIQAVMISCPERNEIRARTLDSLRQTDWREPVRVEMDESKDTNYRRRQTRCAFRALTRGLEANADFILFLEDDLEFNRHLRHNLLHWSPLRTRTVGLASLYNPHAHELACDVTHRARMVAPKDVFGSQAFLISRPALELIIRDWGRVSGMQDIRISRLAGRLCPAVFYHAPSLVQHVGQRSVWGGRFHQARDFDPDWKAAD